MIIATTASDKRNSEHPPNDPRRADAWRASVAVLTTGGLSDIATNPCPRSAGARCHDPFLLCRCRGDMVKTTSSVGRT